MGVAQVAQVAQVNGTSIDTPPPPPIALPTSPPSRSGGGGGGSRRPAQCEVLRAEAGPSGADRGLRGTPRAHPAGYPAGSKLLQLAELLSQMHELVRSTEAATRPHTLVCGADPSHGLPHTRAPACAPLACP